jgi:hypothetical protein
MVLTNYLLEDPEYCYQTLKVRIISFLKIDLVIVLKTVFLVLPISFENSVSSL